MNTNRATTTVPATLGLRDGLARYLADNAFSVDGYTAPTFELEAFGRAFTFRNPPARQRVIAVHDLHHVATGFGTSLVGEGEISAWEVRNGCGRNATCWTLVVLGFVAGLLIAPLRTLRAFRGARRGRNLFAADAPSYDALMEMTVGELRDHLGIPRDGLADRPAALHARAPSRDPGALAAGG